MLQGMPPMPLSRLSPFTVSIGRAPARTSQRTLSQSLFDGHPPLVERKTAPGGGARFKFTQTTPLEQLRQPIDAACHELFAPSRPLDEAIAFLDAVCRQPGDAQVWQDMLRSHGEALSHSRGLLPPEVLSWVKRLRQMAQADLGGINGPGGREALGWAQRLVQGYAQDVSGAAAKACALVNQWARDLGSGTHTSPMPTPPLTPSRAKHLSWHSAQRTVRPLEPDPDASEKSPLSTPHDDSPVGRSLQKAEQSGDVQPLIDALREWPGERQDDDDIESEGRHILRRVLTLCETRELDTAQRADLLYAAYPLLGSAWTCDALLRSDCATALHRWLEPGEATHLLLASGLPAEQLPSGHAHQEHLAMVRTLIHWGLPETAAAQLPSRSRYAWAHHKLFDGETPRVRVEGGGHAPRFQGGPDRFNDMEVDAVLEVCQSWLDAQRPDLALALMVATKDQALTVSCHPSLTTRWETLLLKLKRQTAVLENAPAVPSPPFLNKTFAPWLTVSLIINPANGRTIDIACVVRADLAANAKPAARQRVLQKLALWLEAELRDRNGLPWPLLTKLLESVHIQLGPDMALPSTQWLTMATMQFERSGDIGPMLPLLSSLSVQQRRMEIEGHRKALLDEAQLDKVFLLAQDPDLDAVSRGNLIQNTLPLLPKERNGPGAASHAACLLAMLALDDLLMRANLFDAYREKFPFAGRSDLTPRLFMLASQLNGNERLRSPRTWSAFVHLPPPGDDTAWPVWRALCRELARRMVPRILEVQQATPPTQEQHPFNELILRTLTRLSQNKHRPGLAAERLAELLADLTEAMPATHRRACLVQLEAASRASIERFLQPEAGARPAPVPPLQIALLGALRALIDQLGDGSPRTPVAGATPAFDTTTQFFREWFAVRLAGRLSDRPYQGPDLKTIKLLHEIDTYSPRRLLLPSQADPVQALIEDLFALHRLT
ncbi:MAG TPA: hypothetical protein VLG41_21225 [Hydrogenophaga sp.]|uniref:hypothetical protein n=1 Tax=Hydrogenophaga sp. TaxID=1904254 RepID=UPI002C08F646|nr:hypothetical protein [Hydrogenophaga sp.]HSX95461.1 hypothetical protein [Hydrogenophaga sp.]